VKEGSLTWYLVIFVLSASAGFFFYWVLEGFDFKWAQLSAALVWGAVGLITARYFLRKNRSGD
jgi:uncharacterized membrane protein YjjB (DUF3815 family)